jgi:multidrug efflux system outer membrane protein
MLVWIASCKVSKDVETPKDAVPVSFRSATTDTGNIAGLKWSAFFTDATLKKMIDSAITNNYDMQIALKNIQQSEQLLKQARVALLPDLNLNIGASTNFPSKNSLNGSLTNQFLGTDHIEDFTANLGLSWEADLWGKVRNQKKSALAAYLQSTEARNLMYTTIVTNVAQGFYTLLMLDAQLEIARKNLALRENTLKMITLQRDAGQVTTLAVQQAQAQKLAASQLIEQLEQNSIIQENMLSILAGKVPDRIERNISLNAITMDYAIAVGIPATMISRRPDVRIAELGLQIANAKVGVAKAGFYPALTITASGGLNAFKSHNWFTVPASLFGIAAGGLTQPVFHRRMVKTQYKIATIEREKSVIQFRQSVLNAVGEVSNALIKVEKITSQHSIAKERVTTLETATQNADLLFNNGMANYIEVITAQSNALQSELELIALKREQLSAVVELYRALGGGWQ